jgi:Putative peptidoglycan binding domain
MPESARSSEILCDALKLRRLNPVERGLNPNSKTSSKESLMKKQALFVYRKLATTVFVFFAFWAVNPLAHARSKGIAINHGDHDNHRDHDFDRSHRYFGFPYWWYSGYQYEDSYSSSAYDSRYWQDLAMKVQSELARRGYYHGQINGVIDSRSRQAIRAFQKAHGLPETGLIDAGVLRSLDLSVR